MYLLLLNNQNICYKMSCNVTVFDLAKLFPRNCDDKNSLIEHEDKNSLIEHEDKNSSIEHEDKNSLIEHGSEL